MQRDRSAYCTLRRPLPGRDEAAATANSEWTHPGSELGRSERGDTIGVMEPVPGGYPRRPVIRSYRSGCGCFPSILALPVIVAIAVIVVFLLMRGGDTGSLAACDLFSRSFGPERESQLSEFELVGVLGDI